MDGIVGPDLPEVPVDVHIPETVTELRMSLATAETTEVRLSGLLHSNRWARSAIVTGWTVTGEQGGDNSYITGPGEFTPAEFAARKFPGLSSKNSVLKMIRAWTLVAGLPRPERGQDVTLPTIEFPSDVAVQEAWDKWQGDRLGQRIADTGSLGEDTPDADAWADQNVGDGFGDDNHRFTLDDAEQYLLVPMRKIESLTGLLLRDLWVLRGEEQPSPRRKRSPQEQLIHPDRMISGEIAESVIGGLVAVEFIVARLAEGLRETFDFRTVDADPEPAHTVREIVQGIEMRDSWGRLNTKMKGTRDRIPKLLRGGPLTVREIAQRLGVTVPSAHSALHRLKKEGLVQVVAYEPGTGAQMWGLSVESLNLNT